MSSSLVSSGNAPRRSSRANKGQRRESLANLAGSSQDVTRCICGQEDKDDDDIGVMVQCESCNVWQHAKCMGFHNDDAIPENYFCEKCRPDSHEKLLDDVKNKSTRKRAPISRTPARKKAKVQAKNEHSDSNPLCKSTPPDSAQVKPFKSPSPEEGNLEESMSADSDPDYMSDEEKPISAIRRPRRNLSISGPTSTEPVGAPEHRPSRLKAPKRSSSGVEMATKPVPSEPVDSIDDLKDPVRKSFVGLFSKPLHSAIEQQCSAGILSLPEGETASSLSLKYSLSIEQALFNQYWGQDEGRTYKNRGRSLNFNLKDQKNNTLRSQILSGELSTDSLVVMSNEELANPELRDQAQNIREQIARNSILKTVEAPRIRRTHKGEEVVEGDFVPEGSIPPDTTLAPFVAPKTEEDISLTLHSPTSISPPPQLKDTIYASPPAVRPVAVITPSHAFAQSPSSGDFNLQSVWNHVESHSHSLPGETVNVSSRRSSESQALEKPVAVEQDIIDLVDMGSPEYCISNNDPAEKMSSREGIWHGEVTMEQGPGFRAVVTQIGGPPLSHVRTVEEILNPRSIFVRGRMEVSVGGRYLVQQRFSRSKDVIALAIFPETPADEAAFNEVFNFYHSKRRYGAITNNPPAVKDAILVPLSPHETVPEFLEVMDNVQISNEDRQGNMLLVLIVVNKALHTPTVKTVIPSTEAIARALPMGLSLSEADLVFLQSVLAGNPQVLQNPTLLSDPAVIESMLQQYIQSTHST